MRARQRGAGAGATAGCSGDPPLGIWACRPCPPQTPCRRDEPCRTTKGAGLAHRGGCAVPCGAGFARAVGVSGCGCECRRGHGACRRGPCSGATCVCTCMPCPGAPPNSPHTERPHTQRPHTHRTHRTHMHTHTHTPHTPCAHMPCAHHSHARAHTASSGPWARPPKASQSSFSTTIRLRPRCR